MANPEHVELVKQGEVAIAKWHKANPIERFDLEDADLEDANLANAHLEGAMVGWTKVADVDLSTCLSLETVNHNGPSTIGVDTLVKSQGKIPDVFLRGCGLSPWQVLEARMYDPALTAPEISELQYRIFEKRTEGPIFIGGAFISYSHADSGFVDKLYKRLTDEGVSVWLDRHDLVPGDLQKQVSRAIRLNDVVVLVLSKSSIESDWVENELDMARRKEREEKRDVLCPVALDDSWKSRLDDESANRTLWRTLTDKLIVDFSMWTTEAFNSQFSKLLRGLKINY